MDLHHGFVNGVTQGEMQAIALRVSLVQRRLVGSGSLEFRGDSLGERVHSRLRAAVLPPKLLDDVADLFLLSVRAVEARTHSVRW